MRISTGVLVAAAASTWSVVALPQIPGSSHGDRGVIGGYSQQSYPSKTISSAAQTPAGFFGKIDDRFHHDLPNEVDESKSIASNVISDIKHLRDVFGLTGLSNAQDPAAITQTPTGPANAGGDGAQPLVTEIPVTVNQLQDQPKLTAAQPKKSHWWEYLHYFAGQKSTATTAVSIQASSTPTTTSSRTKKHAKTTSASIPVILRPDVPSEVWDWIFQYRRSRWSIISKRLNTASSPVKEWFGNHTDFAALTGQEFLHHFERLSRGKHWEIQSFFKRLPPDDRKLPLQYIVSGSVPMPVKTWYEALPKDSVTLPVQSFMTRLPKIKGDLPFGTQSLMVVVPTAGPKVRSYLEAIPTESQKLPLQNIIAHSPKANLSEDVRAYQDALSANGDANKLPISAVIAGIESYPAPSTVYQPMDDNYRALYGGSPKSELFKFIAEKDPNYKALQYMTTSITGKPRELPSTKTPVASITGQLAPGDRPAPPAPTSFTFPASALPKVSDIEVLLKQSSISAASGAVESAISRFEPWLHWQSEGPKPTDNLESVVVSYITKHWPTPTSISQIEASLRSSMKKKHIPLSSGILNSVLGDYLDLPPGASPQPSPSDKVQSFVISWLSKNRPLPTSMNADANKISRVLYKQGVHTSRGALLSALNHYRASPTVAPSDAVQTVVVSYYNVEYAKSAIGDIFNQSNMTVKAKDFDKAFGKYYHPTPFTKALPTPSTPIETVVASYLAEHNEGGYPGPYLASSLIPLKVSLGAILSKEKIPAPTGALDSAISRFHNATSAPTPTNSLEGAVVSYLAEQKDKSAIASILSAAHTSLGKHQYKSIDSVYHRFAHPTGGQPVHQPTNYVESVALGYFAGQRNTSAPLGQSSLSSWADGSSSLLNQSSSVPRTGMPESTSNSNSSSAVQATAMSQPSSNIESRSIAFSASISRSVQILYASNILSASPGSIAKSEITSLESSSIYPTRIPKSRLSSNLFSELSSSVQSVVASEADFHLKQFAGSQTTALVSQPVSSSSPIVSSAMSKSMSKPISVTTSNIAGVSRISPSIKSESSSIETIMPTSIGGFKPLLSSVFGITPSQSANKLSIGAKIKPTSMAQSVTQQSLSSVSSFEATPTRASEKLLGFSSFISSWKAQSSLAAAQSSLLSGSECLSSPTPVSGLSVASSSPLLSEFFANTSSSQPSMISKSFENNLTTAPLSLEQSSSFIRSIEDAITTSSAIPIAFPSDQSSMSSSVQASLAPDSVQKTASMSNTLVGQSAASRIASFSQSSNSEATYSSTLPQQSNAVSSLQGQSTFHAKNFNVLEAGLKSSTEAILTGVSAKSSNSPTNSSTSIQGESSIISSSFLAMQTESSQGMTKSLPLSFSLAIQSLAFVSAQESLSSEQAAISASRSLAQSSAFSASQFVSATQDIGSPSAPVALQLSMSTAVSPSKSVELTSEIQPTLMSSGTYSSAKASAPLVQIVSATNAQVQSSIINALEMLSSSRSASLFSEVSPFNPIASVQASQIPSVVVSNVPLSSEASTLSTVNAESSIIQSLSSVTNTPSKAIIAVSNVPNMASGETSAESERQIPSDTRPPPASNNWPQGNSDEQPEWQSPPPPKNNSGELSTPAPEPRPTGSLMFAPELDSSVNFYDGKVYDVSSKTSGFKERMTQAQAINNDLPSSIQKAFNDNAINYYDPGIGDFYYIKTCQGSVCNIRQVAWSCNCYVDAVEGQMKTMSFDRNDKLQPSVHNWDTQLPPATRHTVAEGDTLYKVAGKYGVELGSLIAANPHISNPNVVSAGQNLNVPGQSYTVVPGDSMWQIAQVYEIPYEALRALNSQIPNPSQIKPGQVLKVPAVRMEDPFVYTAPSTGGSPSSPNNGASPSTQQKDDPAYTVKTGDSLWSIAQKFGVTLEEISAVNPSIKDKDLIHPGQLVNVPIYLPAQGSIKYQISSPSETQKESVEGGS